ncbi:MAG: hypothetical protein KY455_09625 [Euryarchaeota archaeon]|nr:hypothetical protein [Euryarchaeota archaeon]
MGLADSRSFLVLTRALMTQEGRDRPLHIFHRLGVPKSPGYRILRFYETHDSVRTVQGRLEADPRRVLGLQGGLRADRAVADATVEEGPPLPDALEIIQGLSSRYAIGMQTAANVQAYFEPSGAHNIYLEKNTGTRKTGSSYQDLAERLRDHPAASRSDRYEFYLDDLDRLDIRPGPIGSMTSPVQTLLDLALHHRTAAHKEFLFDMLEKQGVVHG